MRLAILFSICVLFGCRMNHNVDGKVEVEGGTVHEIKSICVEENGYNTPAERKTCIDNMTKCAEAAKAALKESD